MKELRAGKRFGNEDQAATLYEEGISYTNWCKGTSALMSKAKLLYSVCVLLLKSMLVWRNFLFFMDGPRNICLK